MLRPSARYAFHPWLPQRLGFRRLLAVTAPDLADLIAMGDAYTLMTARNRTTIYREARAVVAEGIPGDFVEIGVHRGGSAALLAGLLRDQADRDLHLFDRWGDLPEPTVEDGHRQQEYAHANIPHKLAQLAEDNPLIATRELIEGRLGFHRARYWQGWYDETFTSFEGGPIAFASIDCDYYESVKLSLDFVASRASKGCRIVLDDYDDWPGARAAADEFTAARNLPLVRTGLGPALIRL